MELRQVIETKEGGWLVTANLTSREAQSLFGVAFTYLLNEGLMVFLSQHLGEGGSIATLPHSDVKQ